MISENLKIKVKEYFKNKNLNGNAIMIALNKNLELKQELEIEFQQHSDLYQSIGKLVLIIVKNIELAKCTVCSKILNYDITVNGRERKFCSNKCRLSKEGNPFAQKNIKDKIKENNIKKYGVDNPAKSKEIQAKIEQTCLRKYGVKNVYQSEEVKQKIKNTIKEKYNTNNIYEVDSIREKAILNKHLNTYNKILSKYKNIIIPLFTANEYIGCNKIYKWKCAKCGNEFDALYDNGVINSRCFKCYPRVYVKSSIYEKEIADFISQYGLHVELSNREIIKPKELDIIIPEKKLAIEFNGSYWHSTEIHQDCNYHLDKTKACEQSGYKLLHIYEYLWDNIIKKQIIKDKIKAILNIDQESIYARKCEIKEIKTEIKNKFLEQYHIQGKDKSNIKLGLFYNNELVAVMTFGKPRFNKKYEWELIRYATKAGYRVIGGAGKLLKYFERMYNPKSLITYADRSYSQGNMYRKLNFKELNPSAPNYVYVRDDIILTRYQCQKHKLKELLGDKYNPKLTETENMLFNGFNKIYDSGNLVFEKIY